MYMQVGSFPTYNATILYINFGMVNIIFVIYQEASMGN
jgi:hypothetical protein